MKAQHCVSPKPSLRAAFITALVVIFCSPLFAQRGPKSSAAAEQSCRNLLNHPALTLLSAQIKEANGPTPRYCYVRGLIGPAIHYHVQLPLPENWNGRFLMRGDGGTDGTLNYSDDRLAQGYAVANSNSGHDSASEPGNSFGFNNRQAEIDFGYRAVHLTVSAAQSLVQAYYGKASTHSYFQGCSTGGRQGLMEAQRYPYDFDGIVAGAPANYYQALYASRLWLMQDMFRDHFAGNLAFDSDGDGLPESLTKLNLLKDAVLARCDELDGIRDQVVDNPLTCPFDPQVDLKAMMCPGDLNGDGCFTTAQIQTIQHIYGGARDSKGALVYKGRPLGSEFLWASTLVPHEGNKLRPGALDLAEDRMNYTYYENDPGVPPEDTTDIYQTLDKSKNPPDYGWWEFNIDDATAGKGDFMGVILDATNPNLSTFLKEKKGKLLLYHGWGDAHIPPEPTLDYYQNVIAATFDGNSGVAAQSTRLFLLPGVGHCGGGPGPRTWDQLAPLVDWVEKGIAPDFIVAARIGGGNVENERKVCPFPQRAVYTGPVNGQNSPANWVQSNFSCQPR